MLNECIPLHINEYKHDFGKLKKTFLTMIHSKKYI